MRQLYILKNIVEEDIYISYFDYFYDNILTAINFYVPLCTHICVINTLWFWLKKINNNFFVLF